MRRKIRNLFEVAIAAVVIAILILGLAIQRISTYLRKGKFAALLVALLLATPAIAAHDGHAWFDDYTNSNGTPCCGASDCVRVAGRIIADLGTNTVLVEINGKQVMIPRDSIHPSETQDWWTCRRDWKENCQKGEVTSDCIRCVFIVVGS